MASSAVPVVSSPDPALPANFEEAASSKPDTNGKKGTKRSSRAETAEGPADEEHQSEPSADSPSPEPTAKSQPTSSALNAPTDASAPLPDGAPPLPNEAPPLPDEAPPSAGEDDGWQPVWEESAQQFYFFNSITGETTWTNPRIPDASSSAATGLGTYDRIPIPSTTSPSAIPAPRPHGGYDPSIHGDYDPTASYAQPEPLVPDPSSSTAPGSGSDDADPNTIYTATGVFNRFTGKWQATSLAPENFNDENKSRRQMSAFFDVDAAANSHDGKSLKAERAGKRLSKKELQQFKEKRKSKKEEKRRAWLRD